MEIIEVIKDKVAQDKGYPSWEEMFNWICRDNQLPVVVGQLIESATRDYIKAYAQHLVDQSFTGWSEDQIAAYRTALVTISRGIL